MEHRAWKSVSFRYPRAVPTMLAREEKRYLFWLGRDVWRGRGVVLEIGPWLGGSTVCLAAGMRASGRDARGRLHAVDNFLWRGFMAARAPLPLGAGESFEPFFLSNLGDHRDVVVSHARALPDERVEGDHEATAKRFEETAAVPGFDGLPGDDRIEILFIDGAKSWRGMRHLLLTTADRLVPGVSLLVCQDFKYWGTYWVPMMMARIDRYVEPIHDVRGGTTVAFRLTQAIPREAIEALPDHVAGIPTAEGVEGIGRAVALLARDGDASGAANVSLARVSFLAHQGHVDRAFEEFLRIQAAWPSWWDVTQIVLAGDYLRVEHGRTAPRPARIAMTWAWQRVKGAWTKRFRGA